MTETAKRILTDAGYNNLVWGAMIIEAELLGFLVLTMINLLPVKTLRLLTKINEHLELQQEPPMPIRITYTTSDNLTSNNLFTKFLRLIEIHYD